MFFLKNKTSVQFIKFCIIGVLSTVIHMVIYYILVGFDIHYLIANGCAFVISVFNSYFWNNKFTFKKNKTTVFIIVKLYTLYGVTTLMATGLLYFFVEIVGLSKYVSPLINIGITTCINFVLNKYFVFTDRSFKCIKKLN